LYSKEFKITLGSVASELCKRPSELMSWTDETEWDARLLFDMEIMREFFEAKIKAEKKASKRR